MSRIEGSAVMRVGVIGAGAAGLCVARQALRHMPHTITQVVLFEQTDQVGGTWVYNEQTGMDEFGLPIHSSMYKNMRTNLPKEVMQFPDFAFETPNKTASFVSHSTVHTYLEQYAKHFNLYPMIKFTEHVQRVQPCSNGSGWSLTSMHLPTQSITEHHFDSIFVCNGHYFSPRIPTADVYKCVRTLHSHEYRHNTEFKGLTVACLGAGPSGTDISIELAAVCPKVYLCHGHPPLTAKLPPNVEQTGLITEYQESHIVLSDGRSIKPDVIIYCTGYHYKFPFLKSEDNLICVEDERVTDLYQHLVNINHPTMFFVGLCARICPFPNFHVQIMFALKLLLNDLPKSISTEAMLDWQNRDYRYRTDQLGLRPRDAHFLGEMQWKYCEELAELGGFESPIAQVVERLYTAVHHTRCSDLTRYKDDVWQLVGDGHGYKKVPSD